MRIAFCDIETNAIDHPDRCWLVGGKMADTGEVSSPSIHVRS
jgi:hypothetical protein